MSDRPIPHVAYQPDDELGAGVEVCELESIFRRAPASTVNPFAPHRVHFHTLLYVAEGACVHVVDFDRHPCPAGTFVFVRRNQIHAFDGDSQPPGLAILFTQDFLDSVHASVRLPTFVSGFDLLSQSPIQTVDGRLRASCEALLGEIRNVTGEEAHDRLIVQLLLAALLLKLRHDNGNLGSPRLGDEDRRRFSRFISLVEQHFHTTREAAAYAQMLNISYKALSNICKAAAQRTPKQLLDAHTVLEAKRRLAIDEIRVGPLAFELGFDEVTNFVKFFKKHTRQTPGQFRKSLSG